MGKEAWWSVPIAVLIGIPMYSNAAGIIPIVQALLGKGAALGTVLAFMMAVIALSLPEILILRKVLKIRLIATFVGVVGLGILIVGYLFNMIIIEKKNAAQVVDEGSIIFRTGGRSSRYAHLRIRSGRLAFLIKLRRKMLTTLMRLPETGSSPRTGPVSKALPGGLGHSIVSRTAGRVRVTDRPTATNSDRARF